MDDTDTVRVDTYPGKGWKLLTFRRLQNTPEWVAAPIIAIGAAVLAMVAGLLLVRSLWALVGGGTADDVYKFLLSFAGVIGAPFIAWRTIVAHQQTVVARESHYTSLFTKALEQLGATREVLTTRADGQLDRATEPNLELRFGAVYALERIATDSQRDHWPIMEVLCAYVRNSQNSGVPKARTDEPSDNKPVSWSGYPSELRVDIQAALTVIGNRPRQRMEYERGKWVPAKSQRSKFAASSAVGRFFTRGFWYYKFGIGEIYRL